MNAKKCKLLRKELRTIKVIDTPRQLVGKTSRDMIELNTVYGRQKRLVGTGVNHPTSYRGIYRAYKKEMKLFT